MTPISAGNIEAIKETYEVLEAELEDVLSEEVDLYSNTPISDILSILLARVDYIRLTQELDTESSEALRHLETEILSSIINRFKEEFPMCADNLDTTISSTSLRSVIEAIFKYLYLGRRNLIVNFLKDYIINKRSSLVKRYKNADSKKDITYQFIRGEVKVRNPDYYLVIMYTNDICTDLLGSEDLSISEILAYNELGTNEADLLSMVFEGVEEEVASVLTDKLLNSEYLNEVQILIKSQVSNTIRSMN